MKKLLLTFFLCFWTTFAFAASISTLTDNFNDNSIDGAKWTTSVTDFSIAEANSEIEFTTASGGGEAWLVSVADDLNLTGSQATIKIIDAGTANGNLYVQPLRLLISWSGGNELGWEINNGNISAFYIYEATPTYSSSATYVAATHRYLKIREASGTIYWDYSPDGINWTNFYSVLTPIGDITNFRVRIGAWGGYLGETTVIKYDDFNILPSAETPQLSHAFNAGFNEGFNMGVN